MRPGRLLSLFRLRRISFKGYPGPQRPSSYTMSAARPTVWVHAFSRTDSTHGFMPHWEEYLRSYFDVLTAKDLEEDLTRAQKVTGVVLLGGRKNLFEKYLPNFTHLKVVANFGAGTNHIDIPKLADLGIKVANTPNILNDTVAEMAVTLLLASARNIAIGNHIVKNTVVSQYEFNNPPGVDVKGSTVGIVGMGNIGLSVARLLRAFGANIVYHNRTRRCGGEEQSVGAIYYADLLDMMSVCDFVILLCPLTADTRHLITTRQLEAMKPTATLINIARGAVVDHDALLVALRTNQIRGAALDVTDPEPLPEGHPLRSCDKVLLTPHWGSQTARTRFNMFKMCVDNLRSALIDNKPLANEVKP